jgi:hypothetical protein
MAVDDSAFRQVVRRKLDVDAVAGENSDAMAAQAPGDVREDDVAVIELDGERRARKDLLDAADDLERGLFDALRFFDLGCAGGFWTAVTSCYGKYSFVSARGGMAPYQHKTTPGATGFPTARPLGRSYVGRPLRRG